MRLTFRTPLLAAALAVVSAGLLSGCFFLDEPGAGRGSDVRGYTDCGTFFGGETCQPGQYCVDPSWSECANGCLSDVNCASNQMCFKDSGRQVGVCENVRSSVHALTGGPDAGLELPDSYGGDGG